VGFDGTTPEDLNKAPVFFRPRVTVGLPRRLSLIIAVDPPARAFGVMPRLLALGIDGAFHDSGTWRFRLARAWPDRHRDRSLHVPGERRALRARLHE
jgi:hypothetical protein